ncbi:MAG: DUF3240 family protein [Methylococcaceae bacterium]|nr:DUF3240 family protein [Methylococcaceae bacterium]
MNNTQFLVTINVPPMIEGAVVDCLLVLESEKGFSSFPVSAHQHKNQGLSKSEQVTGRQREIRFQIYVPDQALPELLSQLRQDFSGLGIQYWVTPVIENGII